jgi:hypothetical protein
MAKSAREAQGTMAWDGNPAGRCRHLTSKKGVSAEPWHLDRLVPINQRAAEKHDAAATHHGQLVRPEAIPESVIHGDGTPV